MIQNSTTDNSRRTCNACGGTGYQQNRQTGINESCPVCGGSGILCDVADCPTYEY